MKSFKLKQKSFYLKWGHMTGQIILLTFLTVSINFFKKINKKLFKNFKDKILKKLLLLFDVIYERTYNNKKKSLLKLKSACKMSKKFSKFFK